MKQFKYNFHWYCQAGAEKLFGIMAKIQSKIHCFDFREDVLLTMKTKIEAGINTYKMYCNEQLYARILYV